MAVVGGSSWKSLIRVVSEKSFEQRTNSVVDDSKHKHFVVISSRYFIADRINALIVAERWPFALNPSQTQKSDSINHERQLRCSLFSDCHLLDFIFLPERFSNAGSIRRWILPLLLLLDFAALLSQFNCRRLMFYELSKEKLALMLHDVDRVLNVSNVITESWVFL